MSNEEGPKLYTTKPKKSAQVKAQQKSTPPPHATAMNPPPPPPPPPPSAPSSGVPPPTQSFARRYKFVWPVLLTVNLAIGGYLFLRTNKKGTTVDDGEVAADAASTPIATDASSTPAASTTAPVSETPITLPLTPPVKVPEPIPEDKQRELFKWILEEKRKVKPKDPEEKKRIDEEKAILKRFIRAKSIPSF